MKRQIFLKKLTAFLLTLLFAGYYVGATMCYHKHQHGDEVLVHSHLFGERDHNHGQNGLETLTWLHAGLLLMVVSLFVSNRFFVPREFLFCSGVLSPESVSVFSLHLRGPPCYNLS